MDLLLWKLMPFLLVRRDRDLTTIAQITCVETATNYFCIWIQNSNYKQALFFRFLSGTSDDICQGNGRLVGGVRHNLHTNSY